MGLFPEARDLLAAMEARMALDGTTPMQVSALIGQRFGLEEATAARILSRARTSGHISDEWADRVITVLELWDVVEAQPAEIRPGLNAYCPTCMTVEASDCDGHCLWCGSQTGGNTRCEITVKRSHAGRPYMMDEADVQHARQLYLSGMGMPAIARLMLDRTGYVSVEVTRRALYYMFKARGWKRRDQRQATIDLNYVHGQARNPHHRRHMKLLRGEVALVRCQAVRTKYPRKGDPCSYYALAGSTYCRWHHPEYAQQVRDEMAELLAHRVKLQEAA